MSLILDDIPVNFEPTRAWQATRIFQEINVSHQLLLFTCHPHVVNLIENTLGLEAPAP